MAWLNFFKKKEKKTENISKEIVLNKEEKQIFEKIKNKTKELNKKEKSVEREFAFITDDFSLIYSISDLRNAIQRMSVNEFELFWQKHRENVSKWVKEHFEQTLSQDLYKCNSKTEILDVLKNYLEVNTFEDENFTKAVEDVVERYQSVYEKVRSARKRGVNTFISQTKLINIKPKIDYCEISKDYEGLKKINNILNHILEDLEYEEKKEEENNAI